MEKSDKETEEKRNKIISALATDKVINFPIKLENTLGLEKDHLKDQYKALQYFCEHKNINQELQTIIEDVLRILNQ